jgi:hypothetical protein
VRTPAAGLCDSCAHQQVVRTGRGSRFSLCRRSRTDAAYPKYPRLPVLACPGHEPRGAAAQPDGDERDGRSSTM